MGLIDRFKNFVRLAKFSYRFLKKQQQAYLSEKKTSVEKKEKKYELKGGNHVWEAVIGDDTYISLNSIVYCSTIGKFCSIGPQVVIGYGNHPVNFLSTNPKLYFRELFPDLPPKRSHEYFVSHDRVHIGNDVWIGANCYIKNGVTIGNGAVIGAGSIVLKDVPPYAIAVGAPAKVVRKRFSEDIIEKFEQLQWWDFSKDKLRKIEPYLSEAITLENLETIEKILKDEN